MTKPFREHSWFSSLFSVNNLFRIKELARKKRPRFCRLGMELLEDRVVPASLAPIKDGVETLLASYQSNALNSQTFKTDMPLIGDALKSNGSLQLLQRLAARADNALNGITAASTGTDVRDALNNAFNFSVGGLSGASGAIIQTDAAGNPLTDAEIGGAGTVLFSFTVSGTVDPVTVSFDSGDSLAALGLSLPGGTVNVGLNYTLPLQLGVNAGGFFVDVSGANNIQVTATATPVNLSVTGTLGFLQLAAADMGGTGFTGAFTVDLAGGVFQQAQFGAIDAQATLQAATNLNLNLTTSVAGATINPRVNATFNASWSFISDPEVDAAQLGGSTAPTIALNNVRLERASVFGDLVGPYLNEVNKAVRPIKDVADLLLGQPIPQLPVTYLDLFEFATAANPDNPDLDALLKLFQGQPSDLKLLLTKVKDIGELLGAAQAAASGPDLTLGSFTLQDVRGAARPELGTNNGTPASGQVGGFGSALSKFNNSKTTFKSELKLDLLDEPLNIFKLLMGHDDAQLVSFELTANPTLAEGRYSFTTFIGPVPLTFVLGGSLGLNTSVNAGYDSAGFAKYRAGNFANPGDLLDGFYIDETSSFSLLPSVTFEIIAGIGPDFFKDIVQQYTGLSIPSGFEGIVPIQVIFNITGSIGFNGDFTFSIADTQQGDRVRFSEFLGSGLQCAFETSGVVNLDASLTFNYGLSAQLPGRNVIENVAKKVGLGFITEAVDKFIPGDSFSLPPGGPATVNLLDPIHQSIFDFNTDPCGPRADLQGTTAADATPIATATVSGGSFNATTGNWEVAEGIGASLIGGASNRTPAQQDGLIYSWRQLTNQDPDVISGFIQYLTPRVDLTNPGSRTAGFIMREYGLIDNPQARPFFTLVPIEDRYLFELIVTDPATGLSGGTIVTVVGLDVNPTVQPPTASIAGTATGNIGVRGKGLQFRSTFTDSGDQVLFQASWNFDDPGSPGNEFGTVLRGDWQAGAYNIGEVVEHKGFSWVALAQTTTQEPGVDTAGVDPEWSQFNITPGEPLAAAHSFVSAGTFNVGLTIDDSGGLLNAGIGVTTATSAITIVPAALLPDEADPSKLALYVGGTPQSEVITLRRNPATGKIQVTMPDFTGEFDDPNGHIYVCGYEGDDTVVFDFSGGGFIPTLGALVSGGAGNNTYKATDGSFGLVTVAFFPDDGGVYDNGQVTYDDLRVELRDTRSVIELSGAVTFVVTGNPDADAFTVRDGMLVGSTVTSQILSGAGGTRGAVTFANKKTAAIGGGAGEDTFVLNNPHPAAGLEVLNLGGHGGTAVDDGATDTFNIQNTSVPTFARGEGGNDTFRISSNAGISDDGNVDGIAATVTIDAGAGSSNRLIVSDFSGAANPNVVVTNNSITGFAPAAIHYQAAGGAFTNEAANDGILLRGSNNSADTFTIVSTLGGSTTKIEGNGGNDQLNVGSNSNDGTGQLDLMRGLLTLVGGGGSDAIHVNDHGSGPALVPPQTLPGNTARFNYTLDSTSVTSTSADAGMPVRTFAGVKYESTEFLELAGTDNVNIFDVKPSFNTTYFIDGNLPAPGTVCAVDGDFLNLNIKDFVNTGRRLNITSRGAGSWTFRNGLRPVQFESIERFNHVGIFAVAADSGTNSQPKVQVYDAETMELKFTFMAYEFGYHQGVRVATGDIDNDGLPDVVTAPGRNHTPEIRVFNGAPQIGFEGKELVNLRISASATYGSRFVNGVQVAVGDIDGDGCNDIVLVPSRGPSVVKVFANHMGNALTLIRGFNAFQGFPRFIGGATLAIADTDGKLDGNSRGDIIVASGSGMRGLIRVFDVSINRSAYTPIRQIRGPLSAFRGGISVATGDVNGDGIPDIIAGGGPSGASSAWVFNGQTGASNTPLAKFQTFSDISNNAPTRLAVRDIDEDGKFEVIAAQGQDGRNGYKVKRFSPLDRRLVDLIFAADPAFSGGGVLLG